MQLTRYTDYSLRVLAYLCMKDDCAVTISEIADYYSISRNHLVKVVHHLASIGFINTTRGKGGGIRLAHKPESIRIGDVVRQTEPNFDIVECFNHENKPCIIEPLCALKMSLYEATKSFLAVLDKYTLADAIKKDSPVMQSVTFSK
jgi:Rrf2 family nitric oxide-sensitive transcriptional repressor